MLAKFQENLVNTYLEDSFSINLISSVLIRNVPEMDLLRTKAVLSSVRSTSAWRMYGAITAQVRLGYNQNDKEVACSNL